MQMELFETKFVDPHQLMIGGIIS